MVPSLPLLSCESSVSVKENPDRKKKKDKFLSNFDPFSEHLGQKKFFYKNLVLSRTTSTGILAPCHNLEKPNDPISRKHSDKGKDGQTLFCGVHRSTAASQINILKKIRAK